jgi:hypothetical protein
MTRRKVEAVGALIVVSAVVVGLVLKGDAQQTQGGQKPQQQQTASMRTSWGDPDLQGIWDHKVTTPLERPEKYANREFLTDEEIKALEKVPYNAPAAVIGKGRDVRAERGTETDVEGAYNNIFSTGNGRYVRSKRTGLIIDPPDGKRPPMTEEGKKLRAARASNRFGIAGADGDIPDPEARRARAGAAGGGAAPAGAGGGRGKSAVPYAVDIGRPNDNPEDRNDLERCRGVVMPCTGGLCGFSRMVQTPGYVTIYYEMGHSGGAYRTIPITNRPHLPSNVRFWLGDSIGRWEGDTLVVDTTNFTDQTAYAGTSDEALHMIEKFKRLDNEGLQYQITIDKPTTFARPFTFETILIKADEKANQIYESACYEGNYALTSMLAGQRVLDKEKATAKAGTAKPSTAKPAAAPPAGTEKPRQ